MAPANLRNPVSAAALLRFAQKYAAKQIVPVDVPWKDRVPKTSEELCELEAAHQVCLLFHKPSGCGSLQQWRDNIEEKHKWDSLLPVSGNNHCSNAKTAIARITSFG